MAEWLDTRDPWLPTRMRHAARIRHWEQQIGAAVVEAMTQFLDAARAGVLGEPGSTGLTAAAEPPAEPPPPQEPPSLDGWPADVVWETLLTDIVLPVVGQAFEEAFERAYRAVITASEIEPYRVIYLGTVWDRLRLWPRGAFDEIRDELADGIAAGETVDQLRNRVGRALNIDARSRAIEDRIRDLEAHIEDPATPAEQRRAARAERRQLYNDLDIENSRWWWKARRIARTETIGSYNAGAYYSAEAWEQTSGDEMWLQWLATSDTRTRGAHIVADGQVRRLGQPFTVGGVAMRFPGDPLAPAHLVVNCRCTLLALGADEATGQQALYERTRPDRTDIDGNPLDDLGRPIVATAAAQPEDTTMPYHVAESDQCPGGEPWAVIKTGDGEVMGCHETRAAAEEQMAAICASDPDDCTSGDDHDNDRDGVDDAELPSRWRGVLAPLDTPSGDGWIIATPYELRTRPLPIPLLYQDQLSAGHDGAIVVGAIDRAWIEDGALMGEGRFDLADPRSAEVVRRVADNFLGGVSVDLDDATSETRCMRDGQLVDCDDLIEVDDDGIPIGVADGVQAVDVATTWRLMAATLVSQPAFAEARIVAVTGEPTDTMPATAASTEDCGCPPALTAAGGPIAAPSAWFADPQLTEPTPITVTDDGRIYGHAGLFDLCHSGYPGRCQIAPRGSSFSRFLVSAYRVHEGYDIAVGVVVTDTNHASTSRGTTVGQAIDHYAHTGARRAYVRAGEDQWGVWVAGTLAPGLTDEDVVELRGSVLSGDWREIDGHVHFIAALAVNTGGLPVARKTTGDGGRLLAMVAAAGPMPKRRAASAPPESALPADPTAEAIAAALHREIQAAAARTRRVGQLQQRITGPRVAALTARMRSV